MTTTIGGVDFELSRGAPAMHQRVLDVFTRNGGKRAVISCLRIEGEQFAVRGKRLCNTAEEVVSAYTTLLGNVGVKMSATFDTGLTVESLFIVRVSQPTVRVVGGCTTMIAEFDLVCQIDEPASPSNPGGLGPVASAP